MSVELEAEPQKIEPVSELEGQEPNGAHQTEQAVLTEASGDGQQTECESMDTQQESTTPVQDSTDVTDSADSAESTEDRKLFIGGLHQKTTADSLKLYFEKFGKVLQVDLKMDIMPNGTPRHRGFAFVTMEEKDVAEQVIAAGKNEPHNIDGKKVDCKQALKHSVYQAQKNKEHKTKKVFVGGVPAEMGEETIREYFITYGEIEEVAIVVEKGTTTRRGFVFVTFQDYMSVDKCIEKSFHNIEGHQVEVKKAIPRDDSYGAARGRGRPMRGGSGRGGWQPYGGSVVYSHYGPPEPYYGGGYGDYAGGGHYGGEGFYQGGGRGYGSRYGPMKGSRGAPRGYHPYGR